MNDRQGTTNNTAAAHPCVLVFRKRLLAYSETFIADQGGHLPHWQAVFTGINADRSGRQLLCDTALQCLLSEYGGWLPAGFATAAFKRLGLVPGTWANQLRSHQPRLIHAHFGPDGLAAIPLSRRLNIPMITTFHGFDICINKPLNRYRRNRHLVFEHASKIIAVSTFIADKLIAAGCPATKITHHHIDIDLAHFTPSTVERKDILFVGRLVEKKGCADLLEAYAQLETCDHDLHIVGDGPLRDTLFARSQEKSLRGRVHFHGSLSPTEVRDRLAQSAVFCVPSVTGQTGDAEGLGMVFLEAQAMGTPVVSTLSGGIPEAVIDQQTGLLVPEQQPQALADALSQILSNPKAAQAMGQAGIDHVAKEFDIRRQCHDLEDIYRQVSG